MADLLDPRSLSDAETVAVARLSAGDVADFEAGADAKPTIRAAVLRALALSSPGPVCGIRLRGARIEGRLDLSCASLPALILDGCDITDTIDVSNARLGTLSIARSRFRHVFARGAAIDGPFDFSHAGAFADEAWIDASKTLIRGGVEGIGAKLKTPPKRPKEDVLPWTRVFALRLSEAEVRGSVWLTDKFVGDGGLCLDEAYVHGTVSMRNDTLLTACEGDNYHPGDALHAVAFRCLGMVSLNFGFEARGRVWFQNATIHKRFNITGKLAGTRPGYDWAGRALNSCAALMIDTAEIGTGFGLTNTTVDGGVSLTGTSVGNDISLFGTKIFNKTNDGKGPALTIEDAEIAGSLLFSRRGGREAFEAQGQTSIAGTTIGRDLELTGASFDNATADGKGMAFDARRIVVRRELRPAGFGATEGFRAKGETSFAGAKIG